MIDDTNIQALKSIWICIFREKQLAQKLHITFSYSLKELLQEFSDYELLYYRHFVQVSEATAHKLLLESLSADSVYSQIMALNPELKDLYEEFVAPLDL
ncbi:hypothetical protein LJC57_06935 [Parabacteroides sp. OttesenSCG-928-G07]|nr:hypothetical protein [Parabacteroides sp. OttesenSCG-928-G07]